MSNEVFLIPQDGAPGEQGPPGNNGADGAPGATGATGAAGPNEVTSSTSSTLVGILQADGANVGTVTIGTGLSYSGGTLSVSGGIGGSTGATDNAILRADGTGGATLQNSGVTISDNSEVLIVSGGVSAKPLCVRAAASQTGNLQEWQNSAGTLLACISSGGELLLGGAAALGLAARINGSVDFLSGTSIVGRVSSQFGFHLGATPINFASSAINFPDTQVRRNTAGVVEINNGTAGTFRDLIVRNLRMSAPTLVPASASATGSEGQIAWDADYIYICTATDTWKRVAIATW
jgi:hypothetical protein